VKKEESQARVKRKIIIFSCGYKGLRGERRSEGLKKDAQGLIPHTSLYWLESDIKSQTKTGLKLAFPEALIFLGQVSTDVNLYVFILIDILGNTKTTSGRSGNGIKTPATAKPVLSFGFKEFPGHRRFRCKILTDENSFLLFQIKEIPSNCLNQFGGEFSL
jgi:hypothetical protein